LKKIITLSLIMAVTAGLSACGNSYSQVDQVIAAQAAAIDATTAELAETESTVAETTVQETESQTAPNADGIDLDLTSLSETMVYAQVYNMMVTPEDYVGKTVKIKGAYYASFIEDQDAYYHYVIIADALACCESGIEIVWDNNEHVYPDEYPEDMTEIEVIGTFGTYEEDGYMYAYLATDELTIN